MFRWTFISAALLILLSASPLSADTHPPLTVSSEDARQIAAEAYIYTYPLVLMDITRRVSINHESGQRPGFGPMNQFSHMRAFPPGTFREVVRPNFDTLYSNAWLDLTEEPVIVSAPDTQGRYYLLPMLDMWTDVIAVPGKRTSGTQAGQFAITGPGWVGQLPEGVTQLPSPTPFVWIIGRTQTNGAGDYAAVHQVQDGYTITRLSDWGKTPRVVETVLDPDLDMKMPPLLQVNQMPAAQYLSYAAELMKVNPPHMSDGSMVLRMKRIGLEPGQSFSLNNLPPELQSAVAEGVKLGLEAILAVTTSNRGAGRNGWVSPTSGIGVYGNEYLFRASVAMIGLGANPAEDAVYPNSIEDAEGNPLMGGQRYLMHFSKEQLPPANAFWSLTLYDSDGFPVPNSMERHAIGDRDPLKFNPDGSLDLYIQPESPGEDKESNWLPSAKANAIALTMRLYWPQRSVLTGEWMPPAIQPVK